MKIKRSAAINGNMLGYKMLIPSSLLILMVSIYPLLNGFYLSMTDYNLMNPGKTGFIGFENIIKVVAADKEFYGVLGYSFIYTFFVVLLSYITGLVIALLLNRDIKFQGLIRALILVPWVIPPVVAATNWLWVLNDQIGIVNITLRNLGLIDSPVLFLVSKNITRITVILTSVWKSFPFMVVVIIAGLKSIPKELYESAHMDGAGFFRSFRHVTLPMIKTVSLISTTLMFIWTFNNFENIYLLTMGGPSNATYVLPILSYYTAFYRCNIGYASAISVVILVMLLLMSVVYIRLFNKKQE